MYEIVCEADKRNNCATAGFQELRGKMSKLKVGMHTRKGDTMMFATDVLEQTNRRILAIKRLPLLPT